MSLGLVAPGLAWPVAPVGSLAVRECVALGLRGWEAVRVRTLVWARPHMCVCVCVLCQTHYCV